MIEPLHRGLTARAEVPPRHRVDGVLLHLGNASGMRLHMDTAARRAFPAGARVPRWNAGHYLFDGHHIRDQALDLTGRTSRGCHGATRTEHLEEIPSFKLGHDKWLSPI